MMKSKFFLQRLTLSVFFLSTAVYADDKDPLNFVAGISRQHDNNLFRETTGERSDNITTTYAGIRVDKPYSLQRLKLEFTVTDYKYQNNDFLDFKAKDYKAAWLWSITPYLTGTLSADRKQKLNDFKDFRNFLTQNISTTENQHFEADLSPHGTWHLLGGFTRSDQTNSQIFNEVSDSTTNSVDAGVKYVYASGSAMTLMGHDRNGKYKNRDLDVTNFFDTGFDETEVEAKLDWVLSGKSKVNLRLAHVKREHDNFSQRDYSGEQGRVDYTWAPTGKLQLIAAASRQLSSFQTNDASYTCNDTLSLSPVYAVTGKITARASISVSERSFLGKDVMPSTGRVDKEKAASVSIDWAPFRSVAVGANLQHSIRNSNVSRLFDYTDTSVGLSSSLYF